MSPGKLPPEARNEEPPFQAIRGAISSGATVVSSALVLLLVEDFDRIRSELGRERGFRAEETRARELELEAREDEAKDAGTPDGYDTEILGGILNQILSTHPENQGRIIRAVVAFFEDGGVRLR